MMDEGPKPGSDLNHPLEGDTNGGAEDTRRQVQQQDGRPEGEIGTATYKSDRWGHVGVTELMTDFFSRMFTNRQVDSVDIKNTAECETHAVHSTPDEHSAMTTELDNTLTFLFPLPPDVNELFELGYFHLGRFLLLGELNDIDQAIAFTSRVRPWIPDGHSALPLVLTNLGSAFSLRFNHLGELDDLSKSIEYTAQAVSLTPDRHPNLPIRLNNLGMAYRARFVRLGQLDDVELAITHISRALALTPVGHPTRPRLLSNLGQLYYNRFVRLSELDDLDKAIEYQTQGMDLTPKSHPDFPILLLNLGMVYRARYLRLNELDDVDRAIDHISRALKLIPDNHPNKPLILSDLGAVFSERFEQKHSPDDLVKSIEHTARAVRLTPKGHAELPIRLNNLGMSYETCWKLWGVETKGKVFEHATPVHISPVPGPYRALLQHFPRPEEPDALEIAGKYISRATGLSPDEHPRLIYMYRNLATVSLLQYRRTNYPAHLQDSLDCFRRGSQLAAASPRDRFQFAVDWAANAFEHNGTDCMEAYRTAIELLPQFIWLGATVHQRYDDLTAAANLAMNAAHAAIFYSDHASALEWLEHARCVVWTQSLTLRTPLDRLRSSHPELADRLQAVSKQLHHAGNGLPEPQALPGDTIIQEQTGQNRRRLAQEYDSLLAKARSLPGFEDFLKPIKAKDLMRAARYGPVVVINCHEKHCDALAILPGQDTIKHLRLPDYNQQKALSAYSRLNQSLRDKGVRHRGVGFKGGRKDWFPQILPELWTCVVKPVLDLLELTNDIPTDSLPHITWCPTGPMTFLPLHAAGDYDQPRSCVYDYAISSYTPTLSALLASSLNTLPRTSRVLAIGQANTPGKKPLPATPRELSFLEAHAPGKFEYSELTDKKATVAAVLNAMEQHDWVHLACHAHQNVNDPTKSGFFLHDGTLDLTAINQRSLTNKGLAFLSACQTATGDEALPDEAIHLASGMLMAGYQSVIATMWSVMDDDAPFVADQVYSKLMKDGKVGNGEAGRALHDAIGSLREKVGVKEFGRWVPYIHIGS